MGNSFGITQEAVRGFPSSASGKEPTCQCRLRDAGGFYPWGRKVPWRRALQPTPAFLPGASHGRRSYSSKGREELNTAEATEYKHRKL